MTNNPFGNLGMLGAQQQAYQNNLGQANQLNAAKELSRLQWQAGLTLQNAPLTRAKPEVKLRTPDEIRAQLEARLAEMEAEASVGKCRDCRWSDRQRCTQPLVLGLDGDWVANHDASQYSATLCGPEKALWEEKSAPDPWWIRFLHFLGL